MVEVSWDPASEGFFKGRLLINGEDSPGVLAELTSIIAQLEGNITKAEVSTFANKKARIKLVLKIRDINHLENIVKKISEMEKIFSIERI